MKLQFKNGFYVSELKPEDKFKVTEHLQEKEIYDTTLNIPYPYDSSHFEMWYGMIERETTKLGYPPVWAIRNPHGEVIGAIGYHDIEGEPPFKAAIGYWLAKPYWGKGIMTEAAQAVSDYGFEKLGFVRITADVFAANKGSARVLEKSGFSLEGVMRKHYRKDGKIFDGILFAKVR